MLFKIYVIEYEIPALCILCKIINLLTFLATFACLAIVSNFPQFSNISHIFTKQQHGQISTNLVSETITVLPINQNFTCIQAPFQFNPI